jgi:hypothetical protein
MTSQPTQTPAAFRFLDLPPEIRNQIYEECATTWNITVRGNIARPPLFYTRKQIKQEFSGYMQQPINWPESFVVQVADFDFRPFTMLLISQRPSSVSSGHNPCSDLLVIVECRRWPLSSFIIRTLDWLYALRLDFGFYQDHPIYSIKGQSTPRDPNEPLHVQIYGHNFRLSFNVRSSTGRQIPKSHLDHACTRAKGFFDVKNSSDPEHKAQVIADYFKAIETAELHPVRAADGLRRRASLSEGQEERAERRRRSSVPAECGSTER